MPSSARFPICFDAAYRVHPGGPAPSPSKSFVDVGDETVHVRMAWAFRADFPRSAVAAVTDYDHKPSGRHQAHRVPRVEACR